MRRRVSSPTTVRSECIVECVSCVRQGCRVRAARGALYVHAAGCAAGGASGPGGWAPMSESGSNPSAPREQRDRLEPPEPLAAREPLEQTPTPERIRGQERFRRSSRLRSSQDFQRVRRRGRSLGGRLVALGYVRQDATADGAPPAATRVGFSISKRVGKAVVRNLVKRRLRESIRRRLSRLAPGWDIVITARPAAAGATYGELDAELARLLERVRLIAHKAAEPSTAADHPAAAESGSDRGSV